MDHADVGLEPGAAPGSVWARAWLDRVFLYGLAGVLLVNAVVAFVHPEDFTRLVAGSSIGRSLHLHEVGWVAPMIGVNDLLLGSAVLAAARLVHLRALVLAWTGLWLLAVTTVKLTAL